MAFPSHTSFDEAYFLGNPIPTLITYEDLDYKAKSFIDETDSGNICFRDQQFPLLSPELQQQQQQQQQQHFVASPQESGLLSVDLVPYSPPSDQLSGAIPVAHTAMTAATAVFSPFSASDDSLYSLSPEKDSFLCPSSTSTPLSPVDPYIVDPTYYQHASHQLPDLSLEDLFMFEPVPVVDPQEFHEVIETSPPPSSCALSQASSIRPTMPSAPYTSAARNSKQQRRPRLHRCLYCPHTSNRANNMKEHILTHDPNRPKKFACPLCGKRFARKHDMKRHAKSPHSITSAAALSSS